MSERAVEGACGRQPTPRDGAAPATGPALDALRGYSRALRWLGARAMSRARLEARLCRAGASAEVAAAVVLRLTTDGWLDDRRYAEGVARAGLVGRGWSARRVRQELRRRGVADGDVAHAIAAVEATEGDAAAHRLESLAIRRWATLARDPRLDGAGRARRFLGWLARRGVDGASARALLVRCRAGASPSG
jgi:regulatory protein